MKPGAQEIVHPFNLYSLHSFEKKKKSLRNNEVGHLIFVLFSSLLWSVNDLDSKKSVAVRRSFFKKESQSKFPRCQGVLSLLLSLEIVSFFV